MMKKLTTMLSAAALMTFGAWAQDAAPVAEPVTADVAAVEAPAVVDTPAPEAAAPAPAVAEAPAAAVTAAPAEQAKPKAQEPDVLPVWEIIAFCVVVVGVIGLGIWKASDGNDAAKSEDEKAEKGAADYFLAGRGLTWWLVGFSLLAANIST